MAEESSIVTKSEQAGGESQVFGRQKMPVTEAGEVAAI
jgi:hypothetical protein